MIGLAVTLPLVLLSVSDVGSVGVRCPEGFICQIAAGGCAVEHNVNQPNPYCSSTNGTYGRSGSERLGVSMGLYAADMAIGWQCGGSRGPQGNRF